MVKLEVASIPVGAEVWDHNKKLGQTPLSIEIEAEKMPVTWQLKKVGYESNALKLQENSPRATITLAKIEADEGIPSPGVVGAKEPSVKAKAKKPVTPSSLTGPTRIRKKKPSQKKSPKVTRKPRGTVLVTRSNPSKVKPEPKPKPKQRASKPKTSKSKGGRKTAR